MVGDPDHVLRFAPAPMLRGKGDDNPDSEFFENAAEVDESPVDRGCMGKNADSRSTQRGGNLGIGSQSIQSSAHDGQ